MKWYLNIKGEKIIGAYGEKLLDDLIEYEADENFDRTRNIYKDGNIVPIDDNTRCKIYSEEVYFEQEENFKKMSYENNKKIYLDNLADEQASLIPFCYDAWDDFNEGFSIEKDSRVQSTGKLFKAKNTVLKTELRPENDPDNFDDLTGNQSTGGEDDVITLPDNVMTQGYSYVYGKFYKKNGNEKVYQCYRGGLSEEVANSMFGQVIVLYFYPDALLGAYFREKV